MSSSSKSTNTAVDTTSVMDERVAADNGAIVFRGDDGEVNITDGGAIEAMRDLATTVSLDGLDLASQISGEGMDIARESLDRSYGALEDFANKTRTDQAQFFDQLISYGIPAIVVMVIAWGYFK